MCSLRLWHVGISSQHIWWRTVLSPLVHLWKTSRLQMCGFPSGLWVLFHWCLWLPLCQYHTDMITESFGKFWNLEMPFLPLCPFWRFFFCYSRSLAFPYKFLDQLVNFCSETSWDCDRDCIGFMLNFGSSAVLTIWSLLIHECGCLSSDLGLL